MTSRYPRPAGAVTRTRGATRLEDVTCAHLGSTQQGLDRFRAAVRYQMSLGKSEREAIAWIWKGGQWKARVRKIRPRPWRPPPDMQFHCAELVPLLRLRAQDGESLGLVAKRDLRLFYRLALPPSAEEQQGLSPPQLQARRLLARLLIRYLPELA